MSTPPFASAPLLSVLTPFAVAFTAPTYRHVLVLVSGTILASGRRTVAALRAVGLGDERWLTTYHRVLNRDVWSALVLSRLRWTCSCAPSWRRRPPRAGRGRDAGALPAGGRLPERTLPRRGPVPVGARRHE